MGKCFSTFFGFLITCILLWPGPNDRPPYPLSIRSLTSYPDSAAGQTQSPEDEVRGVLKRFRDGINRGDKSLGAQLAASGPYAQGFVGFYEGMAESFGLAGQILPMEVGHIKILKTGQAKAETYLTWGRNLFVFTLTKEDGSWKFYHLEGIRFPVYEIPALPYDRIYQIPESQRGFMMAEQDLSFSHRVYEQLKKDHGEEFAVQFLSNGPGFKVAMDAWLPFLEDAAQFAFFLAILESNYYGSQAVVTKATEDEAEVRFTPLRDLEVFKIAVFSPKLSWDEYQKLYTRIVKDRAASCGMEIDVVIDGTNCFLKIRKK